MMRASLVALVAARYYVAPSPATVPAASPAAMQYMAPVSYGFEQALPSAPVAVAMPPASSSKGVALPLMAGAALGATVAVLFGSGKKTAAKPTAKAAEKKPAPKVAAKKPVAKPAKKPVAKAAPKPRPVAPVKTRSTDPFYNKTEGKGGIFPWIVNEKGTYAKPLKLSALDFTGDDADKLIGWGAMPDSVKNLYNPYGRKGLFGGCITEPRIRTQSSFSRGDTKRGR